MSAYDFDKMTLKETVAAARAEAQDYADAIEANDQAKERLRAATGMAESTARWETAARNRLADAVEALLRYMNSEQ